MKRLAWMLAAIATATFVLASPAGASFGLRDLDVTFAGPSGEPAMQSGSHPFAFTTNVGIDTVELPLGSGRVYPSGETKDVNIALPAGLVGDTTAVPRCTAAEFLTGQVGECPDATALGTARIEFGANGEAASTVVPVYNLVPSPGSVVKLGFIVEQKAPVTVDIGLSPDPPYNAIVRSTNISQGVSFLAAKVRVWGVPADPRHDPERGKCVYSHGVCAVSLPNKPFVTLPTACEGPLATSFQADSWQEPGVWFTESVLTHDASQPANPLGLVGCSKVGFSPRIAAKPTTAAASSPSGLNFSLDVEDEGLSAPEGVAQSDIKKTVVALPEGVTANPALAEGLAACSEADLARERLSSAPGEGCPNESKIGTVEVETSLLEQILKGSLYLAKQGENPFGSLLALYVVIKDPQTGVFVKIPGKVVPDETAGRLVSVFDDLPQLPFSHFRLKFREGQRSPLVTPPACGTYTTTADLTPWANPEQVLHDTATFQITSGIAGGPCPTGGVQPFKPGLVAGTLNNSAAAYSPLDVRITRNDAEQEITGFSSLLPPGVTANLNGVPFCPEADIALARTKTGAQEETEPSCPVASQIGHTLVGVGVGSVLAYTPGRLYMAGPFEGAPFSVVAITSAKVGPFDLGTVVVHLPLQIDPVTAAVSIPTGVADQIPHIVKGIVVHVRDIRVYVDRPNFTVNPSNCDPLTFGASVIGSGENFASPTDDVTVGVNDPFQAANCANLGFKPSFKVSTSGKTSRRNGASLSVKLAYPKAPQGSQANIRMVKVDLPKQLPSRLTTLQQACTNAQFLANPAGCPAASVVGHATAITPILPVPLTGPAYFVSHGGAKFPELIIVLQGYGVTIDLHGETFINEKTSITSSTFNTVPDQPVTSFELMLPQGPYSALAANGNLCTTKLKMPTLFTAQNGAVIKQNTPIAVTGCAKAKHKHKKAKRAK